MTSTAGSCCATTPSWCWRKRRSAPGAPPWHRGAESHGLLSAALGVAWRQSSYDGGPVGRFPLQVHSVWAAVCTVAALLERERSGYGQLVTVSGAQAVLEANVASLSVDPAQPDPSTGIGVGGRHPTYTRFVAADGKWLVAGALGSKFGACFSMRWICRGCWPRNGWEAGSRTSCAPITSNPAHRA